MNNFFNKKKILLPTIVFFFFTFFSLFLFSDKVEAGVIPSCGFSGTAYGDWSYDYTSCGGSRCNSCQRQMSRLVCSCCFAWLCHSPCSATGRVVNYNYIEYKCVTYSSCNTCGSWGSWYNVGCGALGCSSSQMAQRRYRYWTCISGTCDSQVQCVSSSSCRSCNCGSWTNIGCGAAGCSSTLMAQRQYCYWSDGSGLCDTNYQCVSSSSCSCTLVSWTDRGCGQGGCASYQMYQTANYSPSGCSSSSRCVDSSSCGSNCGQLCSSRGCAACACNGDSRSNSYNWSSIGQTYDCHSPACYCGTPKCSCTSWSTGTCGGGSCSDMERYQTRSCTPSGCDSTSRCNYDSSCCQCTSWVYGVVAR